MGEAANHWLADSAATLLLNDRELRGAEGSLSNKPAHSDRLIRTIEAEIVPRLIMTQRLSKAAFENLQASQAQGVFDVQELVRLLLSHDAEVASAYVDTVLARGASLEEAYLHLLAPAARELGLLWEEDECDFMDVTVGLCKLHQVLRAHAPPSPTEQGSHQDRRILLSTMPGEQHTFGVSVVAQFLVRAGWDVWQEFPSKETDILERLCQNWFTVAGLTVGNESCLVRAKNLIAAMRECSQNPQIEIMIGGALLVADPQLAGRVGADATAVDGQQTVRWMENACRRQRPQP